MPIFEFGQKVGNMKKRVCKWRNCTTVLNQYNKDDVCGAHWTVSEEEKDRKIELRRHIADNKRSKERQRARRARKKKHIIKRTKK